MEYATSAFFLAIGIALCGLCIGEGINSLAQAKIKCNTELMNELRPLRRKFEEILSKVDWKHVAR